MMHKASIKMGDRRGFSLVELLVAVLISAIIGGAIISLLTSQIQLSTTQNRGIINQENLRDALEFMGDELSNAGSGCDEPYFLLAASNEVDFVGDFDGDGSPDRAHYFLNESTLNREVFTSDDNGATWDLQSTDALITNALTLNFTYYGFNNVVPADTSEITSIEIMLEIDTSQNTTAFTDGKLRPEAMLRRVTVRNRML